MIAASRHFGKQIVFSKTGKRVAKLFAFEDVLNSMGRVATHPAEARKISGLNL